MHSMFVLKFYYDLLNVPYQLYSKSVISLIQSSFIIRYIHRIRYTVGIQKVIFEIVKI